MLFLSNQFIYMCTCVQWKPIHFYNRVLHNKIPFLKLLLNGCALRVVLASKTLPPPPPLLPPSVSISSWYGLVMVTLMLAPAPGWLLALGRRLMNPLEGLAGGGLFSYWLPWEWCGSPWWLGEGGGCGCTLHWKLETERKECNIYAHCMN